MALIGCKRLLVMPSPMHRSQRTWVRCMAPARGEFRNIAPEPQHVGIRTASLGRGVACTRVLPIACTRERLLAENRNYTRRIATTREVETSIFSGKIQ